jgi:hypothetical protein
MGTIGSAGADVRLSDDATTRAIAWLTAWDSQGIHRTATVGDKAGAEWLTGEAVGLGAMPKVETFALDRLDPIDAYLEFDGTHIPGIPVFDAPATGADGVVGTLGPIEVEPGIAVAELSPRSVYTPDYEKLRRRARHRGLVIVCKGAQPGLGLLNAERFRHPYGAPAIHVSSEASDAVLAAAARRASGRLVSTSSRTPGQASNVVVKISGQDSTRTPVLVMTPRSSWWQSTAERGGGLVCWFESLRALIASPAEQAFDCFFRPFRTARLCSLSGAKRGLVMHWRSVLASANPLREGQRFLRPSRKDAGGHLCGLRNGVF